MRYLGCFSNKNHEGFDEKVKVARFARTIFWPLIEAFLLASNALKSAGAINEHLSHFCSFGA